MRQRREVLEVMLSEVSGRDLADVGPVLDEAQELFGVLPGLDDSITEAQYETQLSELRACPDSRSAIIKWMDDAVKARLEMN